MFHHAQLLALTLGAAFMAATAIPLLQASGFENYQTVMTFSAPVQIEGDALPAGTYVFKTRNSDRTMVEVMNATDTHLIGLFTAIPITNPVLPTKTKVEFSEQAANLPEAMHAWFYPGESVGWEFPLRPPQSGQ